MLFFSCGGIKGEFAIKHLSDDYYKKINGSLEVRKNSELAWIFKIKRPPENRNIGIIYLKKELMWVEIYKTSYTVNKTNNIIYGNFSNFSDGEYQLVLTDVSFKNAVIDTLPFTIYSDAETD